MGIIELFMIAVSLSMDAFAVSLCQGLNMRKLNYRHAVIIAAFFGGFQAFMPLLGWLLGRQFEQYVTNIDHWIAFFLLSVIGIKMLMEAFKVDDNDEESAEHDNRLDYKKLVILAVATSIDALAVGITFAFMQVSILPSISLIGITTLVLSTIGVIIGNRFGMKLKSKAEIAGGIVLVLIGLKILLEHLNIIKF